MITSGSVAWAGSLLGFAVFTGFVTGMILRTIRAGFWGK